MVGEVALLMKALEAVCLVKVGREDSMIRIGQLMKEHQVTGETSSTPTPAWEEEKVVSTPPISLEQREAVAAAMSAVVGIWVGGDGTRHETFCHQV